jgi:hypothetical protein
MKSLVNLIGFIFLSAALAAVGYYGINKFYALRVKEMNEEMDFHCAQTYRYQETLKNGATVSYPMEKEYKDCLTSKENLN